METKLNFDALTKAVAALKEGLREHEQYPQLLTVRDGLIQRFEFTYEIAHKMLRRYLQSASPTPGQYDNMPFQDLIRSGNEAGLLLGDWPRWKGYRDMRAKTSHTYDEAIALEVVSDIPSFMEEALYLRDKLKQRISG